MLTSRLYQDERDLIQMYTLLMEARTLADDWRYAHVGELSFHYFMIACHLDAQQHIRLWSDGEGLVAYALLGEDPAFDVQVFPGYEWRGIEEEALSWAEARVGELRRQDAKRWVAAWSPAPGRTTLGASHSWEPHGFLYRGDFAEVNLLRLLDDPLRSYPCRTVTRCAQWTDGPARPARSARREVWLPWTDGEVSDEDYARFMRLPGYERELDIVAVAPDGTVAAFANGWLDPLNRIGDFGPVGRGRLCRLGLTRLVLLEGLRRMKAAGMERAWSPPTSPTSPRRSCTI